MKEDIIFLSPDKIHDAFAVRSFVERAVGHLRENRLVGWLSGGFTPCRHLRPSSGREHTIVTYSVQ